MATPKGQYPTGQFSDKYLQSISPDSLEYLKLSPVDKRRYQQLSIKGVGGSILFADEATQKKLIEEFGPTPEETIEKKRQEKVAEKAYKDFQAQKKLEELGKRGFVSRVKQTTRFFTPDYISDFLGADISVLDIADESAKKAIKQEQDRIYKKYTEQQPITLPEAQVLGKALSKGYLRDQISEIDFYNQFPSLSSRKLTKEDVARIQKDNTKYIDKFQLNNQRQKMFNVLTTYYIHDITSKLTPEENAVLLGADANAKSKLEFDIEERARRKAYDKANKVSFNQVAGERLAKPQDLGSSIIDWKRGVLLDPKTNRPRKATSLQRLKGAILPQRIQSAAQADAETAIEAVTDLLRDETQYLKDQNLQNVEQLRTKFYREKNIINQLKDVDYNIAELKKQYPDAYEIYNEGIEKISLDSKGNIVDKTIKKKDEDETLIQNLMTSEFEGALYESTFAAMLRSGLGIPGAFINAAALETPIAYGDKQIVAPDGDFWNQFMINLSQGYGTPEAAVALTPPTMDRDKAFTLGIVASFAEPLTGIGLGLKALSKTGKIGSIAASKANAPKIAKVIRHATNPVQAFKTKSLQNFADDLVKGAGKSAVDDLYRVWNKENKWDELLKKDADNNRLLNKMSENITDSVRTPYLLDAHISNGGSINEIIALASESKYIQNWLNTSKLFANDPAQRMQFLQMKARGDIKRFEKQAKKNKSLNQLVNESKDGASLIKQSPVLSKETNLSNKELVRDITALNEGLIRETFNLNLADKIQSGGITQKNLVKVAKELANIPEANRTPEALARIVGANLYEFIPLSLRNNLLAGNRASSKTLEQNLSNIYPVDFVIRGNNTGVLRSKINDKKRVKSFRDDFVKIGDINPVVKLDPDKNVSEVVKYVAKNKDILISTLIKEVGGPNFVRQSPGWQRVIRNIDADNIQLDDLDMINTTLQDALYKKHFDGRRIGTVGEQFERASTPPEVRERLLPTTVFADDAKKAVPGYTPGIVKAIGRFFNKEKKAIATNPNDTSRLKNTFDDIANEQEGIFEKFQQEVLNNRKIKDDPVFGVNKAYNDTWKQISDDIVEQTDRYVNQKFNGNYRKYINTIKQSINNNRHTNIVTEIEKEIKKLYPEGNAPDSVYRDLVLDFDQFLSKVDIWDTLIKRYYGNDSIVKEVLEKNKQIPTISRKGISIDVEKAKNAKASNVFDPNISNFYTVISKLEKVEESLIGKAVVKPRLTIRGQEKAIPKEAPIATSLLGWALQTRQANAAQKAIRKFLDENPQQVMQMVQNPNVGDIKERFAGELAEKYTKLIEDVVDDPTKIEQFVDAMTNAHIDSVARVSSAERLEMMRWALGSMIRHGSTDVKTDSLLHRANMISGNSVRAMNIAFNKAAKKADIPREDWPNLFKQVRDQFLGLNNINKSIALDAHGAVIDMLKNELKASNATQGNFINRGLKLARLQRDIPMFKRVRGTDDVIVYGPEFIKKFSELEDILSYGKLDTYFDNLTPADQRSLKKWFANTTDAVRRISQGGLLGGHLPIPNIDHMLTNVMSMASIVAQTIGSKGAVRSFKTPFDTLKKIRNAPDDQVVLIDKMGRKYTSAELKYLMGKANLGASKESVILSDTMAEQIFRDIGITVSGMPKGKVQKFWSKYADPRYKNFWYRLNSFVDRQVRETIFLGAIKDGRTFKEAQDLGRRSIFNYGSLNRDVRTALSRLFLFVTFRLENLKTAVNFAYRSLKEDKPNLLLGWIRGNNARLREADAWYATGDEHKLRLLPIWRKINKEKLGDKDIGFGGAYLPALESALTVSDAFESLLTLDSDKAIETTSRLLSDANYSPSINFIMKALKDSDELDAPGMRVPDKLLYWLRNTNSLDAFQKMFPMEVVELKRRKFDRPTYVVNRYTGNPKDFPEFAQFRYRDKKTQLAAEAFMLMIYLLGVKRALYSSAGALMAADVEAGEALGLDLETPLSPGTDFGEYSVGDPLLQLTGIQRRIPLTKDQQQIDRNLNRLLREAQREMKKYNLGEKR